ncbi:MAG: hypothetical protein AAFY55_10620 [Bacteroidota bacterium]
MLVLLCTGCSGDGDSPFRFERLAVRDTVTHAIALDGRTLVLQAEVGRIDVTGSDTATVATVQVVRTARGATEGSARQRLGRGEVVRIDGDDEIVQVIAPAPQPPGIETAFEALVPAEARLYLQLDEGAITLAGAGGPTVTAQTGKGTIRAEALASDTTTLSATAGGVEAVVAALAPQARLIVAVEEGRVEVDLPADTAAELDAASGTGLVSVDGFSSASTDRAETETGQRVTGRVGGASRARVEARVGVGTVTVRGR